MVGFRRILAYHTKALLQGTELKDIQLSSLDKKQLDELAALVNERGVVFFRNQDLNTEQQVQLSEHFGILDKHTTQKVATKAFTAPDQH